MADKFLNLTDLAAIKTWLLGKFALDSDLDTLDAKVDEIIAELVSYYTKTETDALLDDKQDTLVSGTNIKTINDTSLLGSGNIEISSDGVFNATSDVTTHAELRQALEDGKIIVIDGNRIAAGWTDPPYRPDEPLAFVAVLNNREFLYNVEPDNTWTITQRRYLYGDSVKTVGGNSIVGSGDIPLPTKTSDLTNDGDGESNFATEDYVDTNGGKIDKIKVNGTEQTITNKAVDITVPTKVSDLTNDSGYQTASDVQSAISTAVASAYKYKGSVATYSALPSSGQAVGDVWDVQDTGVNYAWTGTAWDDLGPYVDTSVLWTSVTGQTNTLEAATVAEVNAILEPSA